ncbi:hypothetical protein GCM10010286_29970 [Streptomyces toxytricini]|nr:hypothetical protein GCM10010286_29970 [Streptomyces toxytricini]
MKEPPPRPSGRGRDRPDADIPCPEGAGRRTAVLGIRSGTAPPTGRLGTEARAGGPHRDAADRTMRFTAGPAPAPRGAGRPPPRDRAALAASAPEGHHGRHTTHRSRCRGD